MKKRIAIFTGSFNPFTRGHQSIVERGLKLFDEIIIAIGRNSEKQTQKSEEECCSEIAKWFIDEPRISVKTYNVLTVDFAREVGADFILRGVRTMKDFEYELQMADVNRLLSGIETVVLFAETDKVNISSSLVRELQAFGKDITDFLPEKK